MNTRGNETLREILAAEYALGTLRGAARRRFERWVRSDDGLKAIALQWSERLAPLADEIPAIVPPKRVWDAVEARLPGFGSRLASHAPATPGFWDRLGLWRGMSAAFATVAVVAMGFAMRPPQVLPPQIVQVQSAPAAIATLLDPKTSKPIAVVMTSANGGGLSIKVLADVQIPEGKVLQLWMAPRDADGLLSMGVLPGDPRQAVTEVVSGGATSVARAKAFGLSLEPVGGSPQPTHVLGLGGVIPVSS